MEYPFVILCVYFLAHIHGILSHCVVCRESLPELSNGCKLFGYEVHITGSEMNKCTIEGGRYEKLPQRAMVGGTN